LKNKEIDWNQEASSILKAQLTRQKVKYQDLAKMLNDINVEENQNTIATKLSRGSFSFSFFLQCMYVLKVDIVDLHLRDGE